MKFWLDDERQPPDDNWIWFDSVEGMSAALNRLHEHVTIISLDHDLGDKNIYGNGYEMMQWIEDKVFTDENFNCPNIRFHTANPEGRRMMSLVIFAIERKLGRNVFQR